MTSIIQRSKPPLVSSIGNSFAETAPRTKEHLGLYCATVLGSIIPYPAFCEGHDSPLDALWAAYSDQDYFAIWHAMRGSGKTKLLAILTWLESVFKPKCGTTVLGGSLEQSQRCIQYLTELWSVPQAPRHMLVGDIAARGYRLTNGSWVTALAASQKSVRGPHPQRLKLDEVDEMPEDVFNASLGQPKANHGIVDQVIASSTLHHPFGLMSELIDDRHERGANLYRWCVEEVRSPRGFWTDEEIDRRKRQTTEKMWDAEYLLKRPLPGKTIFDFDQIEKAYERGRNQKIKPNLPLVGGIDWGFTCTVLNLIQSDKERFYVPESCSWELTELTERCKAITQICKEKRIRLLYCDVSPKDSNITLHKILRQEGCNTRIQPVAFGAWKTVGIDVLRFLLEKEILDITDPTLKVKMQKFRYKNPETETIETIDDHYPDALIAWAASQRKLIQ